MTIREMREACKRMGWVREPSPSERLFNTALAQLREAPRFLQRTYAVNTWLNQPRDAKGRFAKRGT